MAGVDGVDVDIGLAGQRLSRGGNHADGNFRAPGESAQRPAAVATTILRAAFSSRLPHGEGEERGFNASEARSVRARTRANAKAPFSAKRSLTRLARDMRKAAGCRIRPPARTIAKMPESPLTGKPFNFVAV